MSRMSRPRFWHSIRFRLLLVSLTLLGIPWAGYRFIQETERFLRDAQDQTLQYTASSVANVMQGHDDSFHGIARAGAILTFRNLFLHPLVVPPQLDGYRDEWTRYQNNFSRLQSVDERLEAEILLGSHDRYLYLLLGVRDAHHDFGDQGDAVDLALTDHSGALRRYRIQPRAPGWVAARRLRATDEPADTPVSQPAIRGEWQNDAAGYTLELRLPRDLLQDRLSLRFFDAHSGQSLASGLMSPAEALGRIVEPSRVLAEALAPVTPPATRAWVTDHQGLVLARSGRLAADAPPGTGAGGMPWFLEKLILAVLPGEADVTADLPDDQTHLFMRPVVDALAGRPTSLRRQPGTGDAVVVSAAVPIRDSAGIKGAVLVEQTTGAILSVQNLALQRLFGITLLFFSVIGIGLLAFAARLVARIDRVRHAVEAKTDPDGHVAKPLGTDGSRDEIGELERSLAALPGRLQHPDDCVRATIARLWGEASEPVDCDLAVLLRGRIDRLRAAYRGVDLALQGADRPVSITAAPDLVAEAIDQLVAQAVRLQRPGSSIAIRCRMRDDSAELAVYYEVPRLPPATSANALERARRASGMRWVQLIGEFHGAALRTTEHRDPAAVMVSLSFPRGA